VNITIQFEGTPDGCAENVKRYVEWIKANPTYYDRGDAAKMHVCINLDTHPATCTGTLGTALFDAGTAVSMAEADNQGAK